MNHRHRLVLRVSCDAGDLGTRKSRSGGAVMWGSHLIKHDERAMQSTTALSSGGSERHTLLGSSAHALGIKAMLNDWFYDVKCEVLMRCDSSAARGMSARQGFGKTRHVDVRFLLLQQAVQEGRLKVLSVLTSENLSDSFKKSLSQAVAERCYRCTNLHMETLEAVVTELWKHMKSKSTGPSRV